MLMYFSSVWGRETTTKLNVNVLQFSVREIVRMATAVLLPVIVSAVLTTGMDPSVKTSVWKLLHLFNSYNIYLIMSYLFQVKDTYGALAKWMLEYHSSYSLKNIMHSWQDLLLWWHSAHTLMNECLKNKLRVVREILFYHCWGEFWAFSWNSETLRKQWLNKILI